MNDLLTVHDVARLCQVHEVTVRRHIASGQLRSVHVGKRVRVRKEDLESYLEQPQASAAKATLSRRKGQVLRRDDPIFGIVGMFCDEPWVSAEKDRVLAEAYAPTQ